jgi:hypothetical protein
MPSVSTLGREDSKIMVAMMHPIAGFTYYDTLIRLKVLEGLPNPAPGHHNS